MYLAMFTISILFGCTTNLIIISTWIKTRVNNNQLTRSRRAKWAYKAYSDAPRLFQFLFALGIFKFSLNESNFAELLAKETYRYMLWLYILLYIPATMVAFFTLIVSTAFSNIVSVTMPDQIEASISIIIILAQYAYMATNTLKIIGRLKDSAELSIS